MTGREVVLVFVAIAACVIAAVMRNDWVHLIPAAALVALGIIAFVLNWNR